MGSKGMVFTFASVNLNPGRAKTAMLASLRTSCGRCQESSLPYWSAPISSQSGVSAPSSSLSSRSVSTV